MKEVQLTQRCFAQVDAADFDILLARRWCVSVNRKSGLKYAVGTIDGKQVRMHRYLLGVVDPLVLVDHINGDTLDNRRINLRVATPAQNQANKGKKKNNTSGHKGVHFTKSRSHLSTPWAAYFAPSKKTRFLGYFTSAMLAAKAYDIAATAHYGDYARLNLTKEME